MHLFDEQSTSTGFLFLVRVVSAHLNLHVFVCVCVHADEVSGSEARRACLEKAATSVVICQTRRAEKVSTDPQKRLISMKKCAHTHTHTRAHQADTIQGRRVSSAYPCTSTDTLLLGKEAAERDE